MAQWPKRLLSTIRPSMTRGADVDSFDLDGQVSRKTESSFQTTVPQHTQQRDPTLGGGPTKRATCNRQSQRPRVECGSDPSRARRRIRQGISPAALLDVKTQKPLPPQPVSSTEDTKKLLFACPFYKLDPETYIGCRRFELSRVKDVKQHLQRKHSPPSYCNRCYKVFGTQEALANHQRDDNRCERRDGPSPGRKSGQQWQKLNQQYQSRGKPPEEQWKDFWRILFPDKDPPQSVYLQDDLGETISRMRTFWSMHKEDITGRILRQISEDLMSPNMEDHDPYVHLFGQLLEDFLNRFQAEIASSSGAVAAPPDSMDGSPSIDNLTWEDAASTVSRVGAETSYDSVYCTPSVYDPPWEDGTGVAFMGGAGPPRNSRDSTVAHHNPAWQNTDSLTPPLNRESCFPMVSDTLPSNDRPQSRGNPFPWGSKQFPVLSSNLSASISTSSLPEALYGLTPETIDPRYWMETLDEACVETCDLMLGDPMLLESQPAVPPSYRYTWPRTGIGY